MHDRPCDRRLAARNSCARPPGVADEGDGDAKNGCSKAANSRENTIVKVINTKDARCQSDQRAA
jgi:hypothetical protein